MISDRVKNDRLNRKGIIMKKIFVVFLIVAMIFSFAAVVFAENEEVVYGDVNGDGKINLYDVSMLMKYIAKWDMSKYNFVEAASDVNYDGKINLYDATKIMKYIVSLNDLDIVSC